MKTLNKKFLLLSSVLFINKYIHKSNKLNCIDNHFFHTIKSIDDEDYTYNLNQFMIKYYKSPFRLKEKLLFINGENANSFTQEIVNNLNYPLGYILYNRHKIGESFIKILENVSNRNIVYIQSLAPPLNDNLMEILFTISSLRRSSANKIIVVIPYFGYAKASHCEGNNMNIFNSSLIIRLIEKMGADQVVTINLDSKHMTSYSKTMPVIDLDLTALGVSYFKEKMIRKEISKNPLIISSNILNVVNAKKFVELLNRNGFECDLGFFAKNTKEEDRFDLNIKENNIEYVGESFFEREIILLDFSINTGETLLNLVKILKDGKANKISAFIYHDLMDEGCIKKIEKSDLSELVMLNTLNTDIHHSQKIIKLSVSKVISNYLDELVQYDINSI